MCFADKFGVVWAVDLAGYDGDQPLVDKKATPLLSHYCSIITNLVRYDRELIVLKLEFIFAKQILKRVLTIIYFHVIRMMIIIV